MFFFKGVLYDYQTLINSISWQTDGMTRDCSLLNL